MKHYLLILTLLLVAAPSGFADLKPASLFQDHMVLQRKTSVPVWGTADPGKDVTVKFGTQSVSGKADDKGNWRVELPAMEANATGQVMTITSGDKTVTVNDVLVGDVWVCSGQSNMAFAMANDSTSKDELPKSANPNLRLFLVKLKATLVPQTDVTGQWALSGPDSAKGFSGVGYYFGKEIAAMENVPVGLIGSYVGGTRAEAWTDVDALESDPDLKKMYGDIAEKSITDAASLNAIHDKWMTDYGTAYRAAMADWHRDDYAAKAKGLPDPPKPANPPIPEPPGDGNSAVTSSLFNGMIAPLQPFAIKGVIWYQGESNSGDPLYAKVFPAMITGWRKGWGQGDFPFLWVQLPNYTTRSPDPNQGGGWSRTREIQADGLKLPATGMAITIEAGDENNLHPPYKAPVGHRLALAAEHVAYGKDLVYSGPLLDSVKIDGAKAVVTFTEAGTGLKIGVPPVSPPKFVPPPTDHVVGFALAGSDSKFSWADAAITGPDVVTLTSKDVSTPVYVRYAWGSSPEVNLYNSADLPAAPFRTDPVPPTSPPMQKPMAPPAAAPAAAPATQTAPPPATP
jgi:sialate O-acetylesterase